MEAKPSLKQPPVPLKQQLTQLLTSLSKETDLLATNLALSLQTRHEVSLDLSDDKSTLVLEELATLIYKSPLSSVSALFKELSLSKTLDLLL